MAGEGAPEFRPTHVVPQEGLPAWEGPDVSRPTQPLDAFLPVELLARRGAWAQILCANGWSAWVDGRLLVAVPGRPPAAGEPLSRAEDPAPLLARAAELLDRYRAAAADLAAGRTDAEGFRRATHGLRAGIVLDGESAWLYDETAGRWMYDDGTRLTTYAAVETPAARTSVAGPGPEVARTDPVGVQFDVPGETSPPASGPPQGPRPEPPGAAAGHAPTRVVGPAGSGERR
ncbi:hypothetical protein LG634_18040 [Streptomyces bambusae]|uniref:hypothetical protein n=1 Tax=Streptomyces bambusae TaxID=1550616 RepID=UPI001CFEE47A|nr:hypothetical protein [Streptomyces bambusae]MCB5166733.1 hypothetical protein [Streptomyces bambusae]